MGNNPKIIILAVSIAMLQCIEAAGVAMKPNPKPGCPALNPKIQCIHYYEQCTEAKPCSGIEICCPSECGTTCRVPNWYKPNPTKGCPPIDTQMACFAFNVECNTSDNQCPAGSICCGDNCGWSCRGPNGEYVPNNVASVQ